MVLKTRVSVTLCPGAQVAPGVKSWQEDMFPSRHIVTLAVIALAPSTQNVKIIWCEDAKELTSLALPPKCMYNMVLCCVAASMHAHPCSIA